MKHLKHLKFLFTALLLLCSGYATAYDFSVDGIRYQVYGSSAWVVRQLYGGYAVHIPDEVTYLGETYKVKGINDNAFEDNTDIVYVSIKGGVEIGDCAFAGCSKLENVEISEGCTTIGGGAFSGCKITHVEIPSSVEVIGDGAFNACYSLKNVTFGSDSRLKTIGASAFYQCNISRINIPQSVTSIGYQAFYGCRNLSQVHITDMAAWCNIDFDHSSGWLDFTSNPLTIAQNLYLNGNLVTNLVIPDGVKIIKDIAFSNATRIVSVEVPASVDYFGSSAFEGCTNLKEVYITDLADWCNNTIDNTYVIDEKVVTANPLIYGAKLYVNGKWQVALEIPKGVTHINDFVFYGTSFPSVTIPSTVAYIGRNSFGSDNKKFINLANTRIKLNAASSEYYVPEAKRIYVSSYDIHQYGIEYPRLSSMMEVDGVKYVITNTTDRICEVIDSRYDETAANIVVDSVVMYRNIAFVLQKRFYQIGSFE